MGKALVVTHSLSVLRALLSLNNEWQWTLFKDAMMLIGEFKYNDQTTYLVSCRMLS